MYPVNNFIVVWTNSDTKSFWISGPSTYYGVPHLDNGRLSITDIWSTLVVL